MKKCRLLPHNSTGIVATGQCRARKRSFVPQSLATSPPTATNLPFAPPNSQLTTYNSQLTTYNLQLTTYNSQLTTYNSPLTTPPITPSKLLLFGEYSILLGSPALALPYWGLGGEWRMLGPAKRPEHALEPFAAYLKGLAETGMLPFEFDHQRFADDLNQGFGFESSIPTGYGLGSSGALCATVYGLYAMRPLPPVAEHVGALRSIFSLMESHFHGNSSGIDPLVCYLRAPLLLRSRTDAEVLPPLRFPEGETVMFLLDTGRPRHTEPLVKLFLEWCEDPLFKKNCQENLIPANVAAIETFLGATSPKDTQDTHTHSSLFTLHSSLLKAISAFQYEHFQPMIPEDCREAWGYGLSQGTYYLKLCGAGGGGFLLGITDNWTLTRQKLPFKLLQLSQA